jgi:hypothetical protein
MILDVRYLKYVNLLKNVPEKQYVKLWMRCLFYRQDKKTLRMSFRPKEESHNKLTNLAHERS